uniref:Uncharacterized protein n=1 Tax=Panagrolaimus sp. ES5 TaxID=591445 RepID=A0AC34FS05_9BILA
MHGTTNPLSHGNSNFAENTANKKYRQVCLDEICIGTNNRGIAYSRFIVPEEDDPEFVKEYTKRRDFFYCVACYRKGKLNTGRIEYNNFLTPIFHYPWCTSIPKMEAEQKLHKKRSSKAPVSQKNKNKNGIQNGQTKFSPAAKLNLAISEENKKNPPKRHRAPSVEFIAFVEKESSSNECRSAQTNTCYNNAGSETPGQSRKRLAENMLPDYLPLKREYHDDEENDIETILSPTISEQNNPGILQSETSKSCETFNFVHPSKKWLETACRKLNLTFRSWTYILWRRIMIKQVKETSTPKYVIIMKNSLSFRALSYLLSGTHKKETKTLIQEYFFENFKTLGKVAGYDFSTFTKESKIVQETYLAKSMTPILWETIAKMLHCRVGIYEHPKLLKFGDWSNAEDDVIITLIFEKNGENYSIVTELWEDEE